MPEAATRTEAPPESGDVHRYDLPDDDAEPDGDAEPPRARRRPWRILTTARFAAGSSGGVVDGVVVS
ncbi:hypothetical protein [Nonomuraea cavernae]|uniref:Uncharacterized protein n=1 Tax=Nonomuraea cavernae TaxID=2045107 RepID=A0A917YR90_9ACTN|nr:hypothetical protein [Nonomuraea cavernae]MCA2183679.1 hypothetical protein [Nonomuraea cavernae]GGO61036.1 hypothetical protein GCM10012289_02310 [Nonomuraea cavernae]